MKHGALTSRGDLRLTLDLTYARRAPINFNQEARR